MNSIIDCVLNWICRTDGAWFCLDVPLPSRTAQVSDMKYITFTTSSLYGKHKIWELLFVCENFNKLEPSCYFMQVYKLTRILRV